MLSRLFGSVGGRFVRLVATFGLFALLTGCSVDNSRGDYPEGEEAISFGRAFLGARTRVSVYRSRSESKPCSLESGEFGPWIDCERSRQLAAKITLLECLPQTACRDVTIDGPNGTYVPLVSAFEVHAVADIEGERVEVIRTMSAEKLSREVRIRPAQPRGDDDAFLEGRLVVACADAATADFDGFAWSATLDGEALVPEVPKTKGSSSQSCLWVRPEQAGAARFSVGLASPAIELGSASVTIRGLDEIASVVVDDTFCPSTLRPSEGASTVGAYESKEGWFIHLTGRVELRGGGSAYLPARGARFVDGANSQPMTEAGAGLSLRLAADPSAGARIEIVAGDRTLMLPVVVRTCG